MTILQACAPDPNSWPTNSTTRSQWHEKKSDYILSKAKAIRKEETQDTEQEEKKTIQLMLFPI